ncbi:hypothetical protein LTR08_008689 [Meristemomyces frigidus]|nr:hypothetical protein LTR08_008689 [Meristemomyces frigidus]
MSSSASDTSDIEATCRKISEGYSACDVSDALLKLKIPQAGFLADITPIPNLSTRSRAPRHLVAPLSTILFVPKAHAAGAATTNSSIPAESNIPKDKHWTDMPAPGTIVLLKQPSGQVCAVCGDILATRLKVRGLKGIVADGRVRDLPALGELCSSDEGGEFQVWSRATSTVGTGLEAKAWAADVPLRVGDLDVRPGDILCADEGERGCVVIPRHDLGTLMEILPGLKAADERCVADVKAGVDVTEAFRRHR